MVGLPASIVRLRLRPLALALVLGGASAVLAQYPGAAPPPASIKPGWDSISKDEVKKWMAYLAGPECAGRGTGQPGFQKAADYMAARFKEFGLKSAAPDGSYFQPVPFTKTAVVPAESYIELVGAGLKITAGKRLAFTGATGDAEAEAGVVFVDANGDAEVSDPKVIEDKIVVFMGSQPSRRLRSQITREGARLIRVADSVPDSPGAIRRKSANPPPNNPGRTLSTIVISREAAEELAKACKADLSKLASTDGEASARAVAGEGTLKLVAKVKTEDIMVPNVVAMIEGSDPVLKDEVVGLGAHLDHLGESNGQTYWGADDDASGNCSLLAIAQAMMKNPEKPKRTVLFMAFCGEEMGLIGSAHYANNPIFPLDKMTCLLQMDMVGRNEESQNDKPEDNIDTIHLVGSKRLSMELHQAVLDANKYVNFKFEWDEEDVYTRSDHYNFAAKGVPIAFVFSGFHPDYHQPTDTMDKINFDKIVSTARLFYATALDAANRPAKFKKDASSSGGG
jgi:hypothetical protein